LKKAIITQSNYIPWKGYFDSINAVNEFVIYDDMQFTKRDWRNRNRIKTPNGLMWLTVPVEVKGKYFQKINETKVSDRSWGKKHWNSIVHSYSKAENFKDYKQRFEEFYLRDSPQYLSQINYNFISLICSILGININISWSHDYKMVEGKTERLVDLCEQVGATDYYTGPAAKAYMDESFFKQSNINVHYLDYTGYPEYPQLHGDFVHEVSIIDLLFNTGNDAKKYMKSYSKG